MLWVKAFHIIAMVAWFAGLFYLPRLFVYHSGTEEQQGSARFKIMERRLYYGIMWPAAILTTILGLLLVFFNLEYYSKAGWLHAKVMFVLLLWGYHFYCGYFLKRFRRDNNKHSERFFRIYNEIPTVLLIVIVILVVVKPF
ncbi:protoporphyrinogen oxidase HemJ [Legionella adelaidensis]|nr:protoporphyrinogen oxidase HemJ [Legionella adelaidensis]